MDEHHNVVLVVGVIGSGKTTLCRELAKHMDCLCLTEAAQEDGNKLINLFYEDPPRYAFLLQMAQLTRRFSQHALGQWHVIGHRGHAVIDGGFFLDTCFARMLAKSGVMSADEMAVYEVAFRVMTASVLHPNFVIRIDTDPEVAHRRIRERVKKHPERAGEAEKVTVEYLAALDDEITHLARTMRRMGTHVESVFWDEDRVDPRQREQAVSGLARMIRNHKPADRFLWDWERRS